MAEVTALRNNTFMGPIYGVPYTFVFPILDADGDLVTGATSDTPDTELSKNGDTFTDCTEMAEIATASGVYYVSLTSAEIWRIDLWSASWVTTVSKPFSTDTALPILICPY